MRNTTIQGKVILPNNSVIFHGRLYYYEEEMLNTFKVLHNNNVKNIVNLREYSEETEYEKKYFNLIHIPIKDYSPPEVDDFNEKLNYVYSLLKNKENIFVHCMAGHGRTGMFIALLLIKFGYSATEALAMVKKDCHGPETEEQVNFVKNYNDNN
jgi:protein-tyrosine phosphatase